MATEIFNGPVGEVRIAGASKGVACTTTAAFTQVPAGTKTIQLIPRNFATAVVVRYALCPWLTVLKTADLLATFTDYSQEANDGSTGTDITLSSLDTLANGDAVYVGSHLPFRGLVVDVDSTNATASTLSVYYWNGSAWADTSASDGSASGGATFAQDGNITWTVPTAWVKAPLMTTNSLASGTGMYTDPKYWVRLTVSAALDSSTTLNSLIAMPRSTSYSEITEITPLEFGIQSGDGGVAGVEALTDAGTANLIINCNTRGSGQFVSLT